MLKTHILGIKLDTHILNDTIYHRNFYSNYICIAYMSRCREKYTDRHKKSSRCEYEVSIRNNTFFSNSHLSIAKIIINLSVDKINQSDVHYGRTKHKSTYDG